MQLVLITFVIGVLNIGLGYALAVWLGWGPPTLRDAWAAAWTDRDVRRRCHPCSNSSDAQSDEPGKEPVAGEDDLSLSHASDGDGNAELTDVEVLRQIVGKAISGLNTLTDRLKATRQGRAGRSVWAYVGELQEICQPYMESLDEVTGRLLEAVANPDEEKVPSDEVHNAILNQLAQLETTLSNLDHMDFNFEPCGALARLSEETANSLAFATRLQQALSSGLELAGEEENLLAAVG